MVGWCRWLLAGLFLAVLVACGGGGTPGGGDVPQPNPYDVTVVLDEGRAKSAEMRPEAGGELTVTDASGTTYTLSMPANALLSPETITMTPISGILDLPLSGGFVGAVHVEPDGLQLLETATLSIYPAFDVDTGAVKGFNSHGLGEEFYLQPHRAEGDAVTLRLRHFSNPGAGLGDLIVPLVPSDPGDRLEHQLADEEASALAVLTGQYHYVLGPLLERASTDSSQLESAFYGFLFWLDEVDFRDLEASFEAEIAEGLSFLALGIAHAVDEAHQKCVADNDVSQVHTILRWTTWANLFEARLGPYLGAERLAELREKADKCARFELEFDSVMVNDQDFFGSTHEEFHVHALVPVAPPSGDDLTRLTGADTLEYVSYTASGSVPDPVNGGTCPYTAVGKAGSTFTVVTLSLNLNSKGSSPPEVALLMDPGTPTETSSYCGEPSEMNEWLRFWRVNHADETVATSGGYWADEPLRLIENWTLGSGDIYAQKIYDGDGVLDSGNLTAVEDTTLILRHTPLP